MAFQLASLPNELLLNVAEKLEEDKDALLALCSVSRKFYSIAHPLLYRTIRVEASMSLPAPKLGRLIRSLVNRPDLAKNVRYLRFRYAHFPRDLLSDGEMAVDQYSERLKHHEDEVAILSQEGISRKTICNRCFNHLKLFDPLTQCTMLNEMCTRPVLCSYDCALFGILLTLTPNIEELDMTFQHNERSLLPFRAPISGLFNFPPKWDQAKDLAALRRLAPILQGMRNIRSVRTLGGNLSLLNLPFENVKRLDIDMHIQVQTRLQRWGNYLELEKVYLGYPSLESLKVRADIMELRKSHENSLVCKLILRLRCFRLKSFSFEVVARPRLRRRELTGVTPGFDHIIGSLYPVRDSLEILKIDTGDAAVHPFRNLLIYAPTLVQFSSLKKLDVPQAVVVPSKKSARVLRHLLGRFPRPLQHSTADRFLPLAIEEVSISYPDDETLEWLECIAQNHWKFLYLRHITLCCSSHGGLPKHFFQTSQKFTKVLQAFAGTGIQVHLAQLDDPWNEQPDFWNDFSKPLPRKYY